MNNNLLIADYIYWKQKKWKSVYKKLRSLIRLSEKYDTPGLLLKSLDYFTKEEINMLLRHNFIYATDEKYYIKYRELLDFFL